MIKIRRNFIKVGPYILAKPIDPGTGFPHGGKPKRSYLYLIKRDFRTIIFKIRIRR